MDKPKDDPGDHDRALAFAVAQGRGAVDERM